MVRLFLTILPEGGEEHKHIGDMNRTVLIDVGCRAIHDAREVCQEQERVRHFDGAAAIDLRKNPSECFS